MNWPPTVTVVGDIDTVRMNGSWIWASAADVSERAASITIGRLRKAFMGSPPAPASAGTDRTGPSRAAAFAAGAAYQPARRGRPGSGLRCPAASPGPPMAPKATVYKAELQVSDV